MLIPEHLQLFWKRFRKALPRLKIRYLACGEYGEKSLRPHYHAIIFGYAPETTKTTHEDPILEKIWGKGIVYVGTVTQDSIRYVADYVLKSQHVPRHDRDPNFQYPFLRCSRGLGKDWLLSNTDRVDRITLNGVPQGIPRYYAKTLQIDMAEHSKEHREEETAKILAMSDDRGQKVYQVLDSLAKQRGLNADAKLKLIGEKKL